MLSNTANSYRKTISSSQKDLGRSHRNNVQPSEPIANFHGQQYYFAVNSPPYHYEENNRCDTTLPTKINPQFDSTVLVSQILGHQAPMTKLKSRSQSKLLTSLLIPLQKI